MTTHHATNQAGKLARGLRGRSVGSSLAAILLTLSSGLALAQPPADQPPAASSPIPWANKLFLPSIDDDREQMPPTEIVHDFGAVPRGSFLVHRFTLTNIYEAPLQVTELRRSSDSLQAYPPQRVVQPNEKADFVLTLDTSRATGTVNETLFVTVGPMFVSTAKLRVSATVRGDILQTPGQLAFGNVPEGSPAQQTVTLEYSGRQKDWKPGVLRDHPLFDLKLSDLGRGRYKVTFALKPSVPAGPLNETVLLPTNDPTLAAIPISVRGVIQGPVEITPPAARFNNLKVGEPASLRISIRGNGVGAFTIDGLNDNGNGFSVVTIGVPSPVHTIVVNFTPSQPGPFREVLELKTSLKQKPTISLVVEGDVQGNLGSVAR